LMSLSSFLKLHGYQVVIWDLWMELDPYESLRELLSSLNECPLIFGISTFTDVFTEALGVARLAKESFPDSTIVLGGAHVSFCFDEALSCSYVDYIVKGESESTLVVLLEYLKNQASLPLCEIRGIVYFKDGVIENSEREYIKCLDSLPYPDYKYSFSRNKYKRTLPFISSRGCPGQCIFCASRFLSGSRYRKNTAEWLFSLVYYYLNKYNLPGMGAVDDTFTVDKSRLTAFCNYMINSNMNTPWTCRSRADTMTEATLLKLKEATKVF